MINDKGILIRNIYYMLSYAFQVLKQTNYRSVETEEFEDAEDLMAAILTRGVSQQLKQGLYKEYIEKNEILETLHGRIVLPDTIREYIAQRQRIACEFDELSENNIFNQILKTTLIKLLSSAKVKRERRHDIKRVLLYFETVDTINVNHIPWSRLQINSNNKSYEMLMNICRLALDDMIQTSNDGEKGLPGFLEENMAGLYERFIREYYRQHYGKRLYVSAAQVEWNLTGSAKEGTIKFLPKMQTDIMLRDKANKEKTLIIDAKYYSRILQRRFDSASFHSHNMYQIYAYVMNEARGKPGNVSGLLLYAKTEENVSDSWTNIIGGNQFSVKTLDLNRPFTEIAGQLDQIVVDYFGGASSA